jgi:DNA-binding NarL/FixJ family response regulator
MKNKVIDNHAKLNHSNLLTNRELQCLTFLSEGLQAKEVAKKMSISNDTVISHSRSIRRKLDSRNITQAVTMAYRHGLLKIVNNETTFVGS